MNETPPNYIPRALESVLKRAAGEFPVVTVTGPRQSGKTTLLKHLFSERPRGVAASHSAFLLQKRTFSLGQLDKPGNVWYYSM